MKNIRFPVYFTTLALLVYSILLLVAPGSVMVIVILLASPFLIVWMVIRVLKDGVESSRSFEEYFYDDVDIKRLTVKEELQK